MRCRKTATKPPEHDSLQMHAMNGTETAFLALIVYLSIFQLKHLLAPAFVLVFNSYLWTGTRNLPIANRLRAASHKSF